LAELASQMLAGDHAFGVDLGSSTLSIGKQWVGSHESKERKNLVGALRRR